MSTEPNGWQAPKTDWDLNTPITDTELNKMGNNTNAIETGSRNIDPAQTPTGLTGTLRNFLDWFANRIKAITGKTNWYDAPDTTLAGAKGHMDAAAPHSGHETPAGAQAKVDAHAILTNTAHGATSAATPSTQMARDANGRTKVADPVAADDVATKAYVDAVKQGLNVKESVRVATTANITLSGTQTIDGVAVVAGNRVLAKNQTAGSQNGIYVVAAGAWSRSVDADSNSDVTAGMFTFVEEGTTNADSGWVLTTNDPITLGTTALTFVQFSGAGQIVAGAGLSKIGNTLSLASDADAATVGGKAPGTAAGNLAYYDTNGKIPGVNMYTGIKAIFSNTSQSIAANGSFALNVPLGASEYKFAVVMLQCTLTLEYRGAIITCTDTAADAFGRGSFSSTYIADTTTNSKTDPGYLTSAVFDSTGAYIRVEDAYISGSNLVLVFENTYASAAKTLAVRGLALVTR